MIRFLHTSDWHLGRLLYGKSLLDDQEHALKGLLALVDELPRERKPHALIIAGDIFDRALPPEAAIALFSWFCEETVQKRKLPVFLIPGNHDSNERLGFGSQLLRLQGLTIFSHVRDALKPARLKGDQGDEALVYGIPFVDPQLIAQFLGEENLKTPDLSVRALTQKILAEKNSDPELAKLPSILLCHAFVVGGEASESERDLFIGGSSFVSTDAFDGFSYTALGHLHKPQTAGRESVRYSGSLLSYSKSELSHAKSVTEVELASDGSFKLKTHALPVRRDLIFLEGPLETLIANAAAMTERERDSYVIAGLMDTGPVLDAHARLRAVFPNLLHAARSGGYRPTELPSLEARRLKETLSDLDLFAEFFQDSTNSPLSDDEREQMIAVLKSIEAADRERSP